MSASESWSAQRAALAMEALRGSGRLRVQVRGESMLPTLWPGDIAEIACCQPEDLHRGDIVFAFCAADSRFYLHRLLGRFEDTSFTMRGDSMPSADPPFPVSALLGKLESVVRDGQLVPLRSRRWSRLAGLIFCHCSIARRAALKLRSPIKRQRLAAADLESA